MLNLLKYEFKSNLKLIAGMFVALIAWNIFLITKINVWQEGSNVGGSTIAALILFVVIFIQGIRLLKQDLYENTGYLIFTLPKKGAEILGAKLIFALAEFLVFGVFTSAIALLQISILPGVDFSKIIQFLFSHISAIISLAAGTIALFTAILILCYFSLTISRVAFKGRKFGTAVSFGVFIVLSIAIEWLQNSITRVFPYTVPLKVLEFSEFNASVYPFIIDINVAFMVSFVVIYTALFLSTSYLIDNKIDL